MVFVSHETYTPARGGSASAEIHALRRVFGDVADSIVIANTKGFTGHAMATGIEDVVAVKALETGCVPPVANFKEVDPELGQLNLSKGGTYPVEYAIHLGAGFGSQISMMLLRWVKTKDGIRPSPNALGYAYRIADDTVWNAWLSRIAGHPAADLEVVHRTLRVRDQSGSCASRRKCQACAHAHAHRASTVSRRSLPRNRCSGRQRARTKSASASRCGRSSRAAQTDRERRSGERASTGSGGRENRLSSDMLDLDLDSKPTRRRHGQAGGGLRRIREAYSIRATRTKLRDFRHWHVSVRVQNGGRAARP